MSQNLKLFLKTKLPYVLEKYREWRDFRRSKQKQTLLNGVIFKGAQNAQSYEPHIFQALKNLAKDYNLFVNLGANHGLYVLSLHHLFERIIAFEASAKNQTKLLENVFNNGLDEKVFVAPFAAGKTTRIEKLYGFGSGSSLLEGFNNQKNFSLVQALPAGNIINSFVGVPVGLYLIDVEGAEWRVLEGLKEIVSEKKSTFVVEISCSEFMPNESFNPDFKQIFDLFFKNQYKAYEVKIDGKLSRITNADVQYMKDTKRKQGFMAVFTPQEAGLI